MVQVETDIADIAQLRGLALAVAEAGEDVQGFLVGVERGGQVAELDVDRANIVELGRALDVAVEAAVDRQCIAIGGQRLVVAAEAVVESAEFVELFGLAAGVV